MLRIEQELQARGVSHAELCRMTGIHTSTISRLVAGKMHPYPGWKRRIEEALGVNAEDLFEEIHHQVSYPATDPSPRAS